MKNVIIRSLSGIIYVALIVFCTLFGDYWFLGLTLLLGIGGMYELFRLVDNDSEIKRHPFIFYLDMVAGILIIVAPQACILFGIAAPCSLLSLYLPIRLIVELYTKDENPAKALGTSFFALSYIAVPLAMLNFLEILSLNNLILATFILIWLSDTGAFCVGSLIGKRRLFPRISPKKSWEGFLGGMIFCIAASFVMIYCFPNYFTIKPELMIAIGVFVPVAATYGDLVESMLKRSAGVKDSGSIMPGHGGFLDRTDSLLLVVPVVFILNLIIQ